MFFFSVKAPSIEISALPAAACLRRNKLMEADHALRKVTCDEMTTKKEMAVRRGIGYTLGSVGGISIVYDGAQRLGVGATAVTLGAGLMLHRMGVLSQ